jgi:hypothetical protein
MNPIRSLKILLVDDNPTDRDICRRYLLEVPDFQWKILEAASGVEAMTLCAQQQPDVILVDYQLPDLNSLEFLSKLGDRENLNRPPVIVLVEQGHEYMAVRSIVEFFLS